MDYFKQKPSLKVNLTGSQIEHIFDSINSQMIYNLNQFTTVLEPYFVQLLGWVANNRRKKISSLARPKQLNLLFYSIYTDNRSSKFRTICKLKLDRSFIRGIVTDFLKTVKDYPNLYMKYLRGESTNADISRMVTYETLTGCSRAHLYPLINNLEQLLALSLDFRSQIAIKYYKFIWKLVNKTAKSTPRYLDKDDLMQNYIAACLKALDRYDSTKGALTSYIRFWILNNDQSAEESPEYGIAYDIPSTQRLDSVQGKAKGENDVQIDNFSTPLDDILTDDKLASDNLSSELHSPDVLTESTDEYLLILRLSKLADPIGVARLSLGIEEFFAKATIHKMHRYMSTVGLKLKTVNYQA